MSQLIYMRQRIKAIETIKKITHAMRLISMSTHSRLRQRKTDLERYKKAFQTMWNRINSTGNIGQYKSDKSELSERNLIILVGSQKGLIGTFNTMLFKFFEIESKSLTDTADLITVGKHATDYFKRQEKAVLASYDNFNLTTFVTIAYSITHIILKASKKYKSVILFSNYPKSFFVQQPKKSFIIQEQLPEQKIKEEQEHPVEYILEQSPEELSGIIEEFMLAVTIQELLFESLLAEQAARFLSMDTATRNADNLLNTMKLEYNKIRQASITRELTELSSSF